MYSPFLDHSGLSVFSLKEKLPSTSGDICCIVTMFPIGLVTTTKMGATVFCGFKYPVAVMVEK
jgi:hypothetical protein